jgi:hypothetical protein
MAVQYVIYTCPDTGKVYRDGVRSGNWVLDVEITHGVGLGFYGAEGVDWENIETVT